MPCCLPDFRLLRRLLRDYACYGHMHTPGAEFAAASLVDYIRRAAAVTCHIIFMPAGQLCLFMAHAAAIADG